MKKIIVDMFGGDNAPVEVIEGVKLALIENPNLNLILVGDKNDLLDFENKSNIEIIHTDTKIDMGEKDPLKQFRKSKNSSMFLGMNIAKESENYAFLSAGPTQALVMGGHLVIKRISVIKRIALCPVIPNMNGNAKVLLDVGANVDIKPEHLKDFAIMGSVIYKEFFKKNNVNVGLLNIGTEEKKGRDIDKEAFDLLKEEVNYKFIGNIEPKELFITQADVIVTDGFSGNIALKTMEGTAKEFATFFKNEIKSGLCNKIGYLFMKNVFKKMKSKLDPNNLEGAILLGLNNLVIKVHGSSNRNSFRNGILQANELLNQDIISKIKTNLNEIYKEDDNNE